ncbi:MAG: endonuclease III [Deltaproteobacteria bacterium]|nr:endonuclease III [Deltaproteobacteria bacterium]
MPKESHEQKAARTARIIDALEEEIPEARIALDSTNDLELLVSVMLSAQTMDSLVNKVTPALFAKYRTAQAYADASEEELQQAISRIGLFRNKAKNLKAAMTIIVRDHGGQIPRTREALNELPGVGWKTAGVVAYHAFGTPAFPVDTHVGRLSRRLGLTSQEDPAKVEEDLQKLLPPERWGRAHQLIIWHGRRTCHAQRPQCDACVIEKECPRVGVTLSDLKSPASATKRAGRSRPAPKRRSAPSRKASPKRKRPTKAR